MKRQLKSFDNWNTAKTGLNAALRQKEQVEKRYYVGLVALMTVQHINKNRTILH